MLEVNAHPPYGVDLARAAQGLRNATTAECETFSHEVCRVWDQLGADREDFLLDLILLANAFGRAEHPEFGIPLATRAVAYSRRRKRDDMAARALGTLGVLQLDAGHLDQAETTIDKGLVIFTLIGDRSGIVKSLVNLGIVKSGCGATSRAMVHFQCAAYYTQTTNDPALTQLVDSNITVTVHRILLDLLLEAPAIPATVTWLADDNTLDAFVSGIPAALELICSRMGGRPFAALFNLISGLAIELVQNDRFDHACALFQEAHDIARDLGAKRESAESLLNLLAASVPTTDHARTLAAAEHCLTEACSNALADIESICLINRGSFHESQGKIDAAAADYRAAKRIASGHGINDLLPQAQAALDRIKGK